MHSVLSVDEKVAQGVKSGTAVASPAAPLPMAVRKSGTAMAEPAILVATALLCDVTGRLYGASTLGDRQQVLHITNIFLYNNFVILFQLCGIINDYCFFIAIFVVLKCIVHVFNYCN